MNCHAEVILGLQSPLIILLVHFRTRNNWASKSEAESGRKAGFMQRDAILAVGSELRCIENAFSAVESRSQLFIAELSTNILFSLQDEVAVPCSMWRGLVHDLLKVTNQHDAKR